MNILKKIFSLRTVRKKIVMLSKIAGILLILSYVLSMEFPFSENLSFLIWIIFVIILVLIIDYLLGRFISSPITKLCNTAKRMAELDFSASCTIASDDEFGDISNSLNKMAGNLQQAFSKLEEMNMQLEKDIEHERVLLQERKELVDDLSHEMKTPLGVIRAYAEGIQDETDDDKIQKYSEIIIDETERMSNLITTLLDLSALENGAIKLHLSRFDFVEFLETIAGRLLIDMPDTNFKLQYELPEHKVYVFSDKERMEQVLDNLIINAKRNVTSDGILKISLIEQKDNLFFSIYNQGMNITQEELPKIWAKFYRHKNSAYSGSGLGLAIVAQILSMQNIDFGVENKDTGVEFYFTIPIVK